MRIGSSCNAFAEVFVSAAYTGEPTIEMQVTIAVSTARNRRVTLVNFFHMTFLLKEKQKNKTNLLSYYKMEIQIRITICNQCYVNNNKNDKSFYVILQTNWN